MKPLKYSGHVVDVPEAAPEAAADFDCPIYRCSMPGASCAARHRGGVGGSSMLGTCARCPAGAARARLLAPGAPGAPRVSDRLSPAARESADLIVTTLRKRPMTWAVLSKATGLEGAGLHQALAAAAGDGRITAEGVSKSRIYRAAEESPSTSSTTRRVATSTPSRANPKGGAMAAVSDEKKTRVIEALQRLGGAGKWGPIVAAAGMGNSSAHAALKALVDEGVVVAEPGRRGQTYRLSVMLEERETLVEDPVVEMPAAVEEPAVLEDEPHTLSPAVVAPQAAAAADRFTRIQEVVADLRRILRPAPGETLLQAAERLRRVADQADAVAAVAHDIATELGIA